MREGRHFVQSGPFKDSSVLHSPRVKQSELFDRWRSLQMCKWAMNISEANQFKYV